MFENLGEVMPGRHQNKRKRFVVTKQNIIFRGKPLDHVRFKQKRLGLGMGCHKLHGCRFVDHPAYADRLAFRCRIGDHPFFQIFRFTHIQNIAFPVHHPIDAGITGQGFQVAFNDAYADRRVVAACLCVSPDIV